MPDSRYEEVARMDWEQFEKQLEAPTRGAATRGGVDDSALEEYFGKEEYEELKELAAQARRTRSRAGTMGNIVMVPGIMGSNLALDGDTIWVNLFRIALGRIGKLRLSDGGGPNVLATAVDKRTYTRAILKLGARWNVKPCAFDWRKDINAASDSLNDFIKREFDDQPVHIVAHSMGGLVSRNFIRRHPETWAGMRGDGRQGGRLVMLGTPNYGSFAIPQVMTGAETLVRWLARIDLSHDLTEVLQIINSFVGSYQMLPAPSKIPAETRAIYELDTWGAFRNTIEPRHLARAEQFHDELANTPATIDPDRMTYIAGCNRKTIKGLTVLEPGEFQYEVTTDGDGRVPHSLGLLDGVSTFYVDEDHGSLPKNDKVIAAVDQLLETGRTTQLATRPVTSRGALPRETRWSRPISEHYTAEELEDISRRANEGRATPDEVRAAEKAMMRAIMGEDRPERDVADVKEKKKKREEREGRAAPAARPALTIDVAWGDITQIVAPVVTVGQYKGVAPINAVGALDRALGRWISQANSRSMIGAELGQLFFIPAQKGQLGAKSVLLAGMGEEGRFSQDDLRYLMSNVTYAVSALKLDSFATVLIGAGAGNLSENNAIRSMLFGICDALHGLWRDLRGGGQLEIRKIIIVENNKERAKRIGEMLDSIKEEDSAVNFDIKVKKREIKKVQEAAPDAALQQPQEQRASNFYPRITVEHGGDTFRFSALTKEAVIPVREVEIQSFFSDGIAERLIGSSTREEQETLGRLLQHLFPEDFQQLLDPSTPLSLVLDGTTASYPWEMACFSRPQGNAFFGTHLSLARQFRTLLSSAPSVSLQPKSSLRVLVIADPPAEREYQLPGARKEGRAVARVLNQIKQEYKLDIEVVDRIGADECDPIQLLALILDGNFDVIHYAGHGFYDQKKPSHGGWVFGEKVMLTAREIFRLRRAPRLIFANACFSAVVAKQPLTAEQMNRSLAGIAEAFFERGVPNYLGAGWPVQDDLAVEFATNFYSYALTGKLLGDLRLGGASDGSDDGNETASGGRVRIFGPQTLGESIAKARHLILHDGSTWGAYQHYGNAADVLMKPPTKSSGDGGGRRAAASTASSSKKAAPRAKKPGARKSGSKKSGKKRG